MPKKTDPLFVSDVFDIDKEVELHGNKIFLIAGVGSGKSSWVKDVLTKKGSVLFVTSRKAKVEEDVNCSCFSDVFKWRTNDNQTLITNAKLSFLVERIVEDFQKDLDEFIGHFDYIVVDEVHSMATDSVFAESCSGLLSFIEYVANKGKIIVTMTGTPEPVYRYFSDNEWYILDYRHKCRYVHPEKIILTTQKSVISKIRDLRGINQIVYFVNNTDTIIDLCKELLEKSYIKAEEIAISVAKSKENDFYDRLAQNLKADSKQIIETSKRTYESIIIDNKIPANCMILFSTSTLREGIDIENDNMVMFCENHILSNLIQFFGRIRSESCKVYVVEDSVDHRIEQSKLLYEYAVEEETEAANRYLKNQIEKTGNDSAKTEKKELIEHVTKNPYVYFDYIDGVFKVFHLRYKEETRLKNNFYWKGKLADHCEKYAIPFLHFDLKKIMQGALVKMVDEERKAYKESKAIVTNMFKRAYGIEDVQPMKKNEKLESKNAPIRMITGKDNGGDRRNESFWKLVRADSEEYRKWKEKEDKKREKKKRNE